MPHIKPPKERTLLHSMSSFHEWCGGLDRKFQATHAEIAAVCWFDHNRAGNSHDSILVFDVVIPLDDNLRTSHKCSSCSQPVSNPSLATPERPARGGENSQTRSSPQMRVLWFRKAVLAIVATSNIVFSVNAQAVTLPPAHGQFDYQLGGEYTPLNQVAVVVRDRRVTPVPGKYNICYVNTFQTQPADADWWKSNHPELLVKKNGEYVTDPKWEDEYLMDTSTETKRSALIAIVGPWIDKCAADGFNAVEPDNLDSFARSKGVLTEASNTEFAKLLVNRAHSAKLAIAQKNTSSLVSIGASQIGFDFAIVEECQVFSECDAYSGGYGNLVYEIEYNDNDKDANGAPVDPISFFNAACAARGKTSSIIYRDRKVVPSSSPQYEYKWCK